VRVHLLVHVLGLIACAAPLLAQERVGPVVTSLTIFAGTETGLWRSSDWGYRWEKVQGTDRGDSLKEVGPVRSILALGPKVYIGAETGLYVSEDFGQTWTRTSLTTPVTAVLPSRYPLSDPTLFAGTSTGLLKSVDAAKTFLPTAIRDAAIYRLEWPGPALIVATARGVMVSKDAATNADGLGTGLPPGEVRALAVSSYFMVDPVMFAGVGAAGVHRSQDGGKTWSPSGLEGQAVTDLAWLGPILFAVSDKGLFRSEDAGKTWTPLGEGLKGDTPARMMFPLAPDSAAEFFVGTDRGVFRTNDGGLRWLKAGLDEERVLCLGTFPPPDKPQKVRKH
jgi:ligand-binding sensor domain-containing protein